MSEAVDVMAPWLCFIGVVVASAVIAILSVALRGRGGE